MKVLLFIFGTLFGMSISAATAVILVQNGTVLEYVLQEVEVNDVNSPVYFVRFNGNMFASSQCYYGDVSRWNEVPRLKKWRPLNDYLYFARQKFPPAALTAAQKDFCFTGLPPGEPNNPRIVK